MGPGWSLCTSIFIVGNEAHAFKWHLRQFGRCFTLSPESWLIDINSMPCPGHTMKCENDGCLWATVTWRSWNQVSSQSCGLGWKRFFTDSLKCQWEDFEEEL